MNRNFLKSLKVIGKLYSITNHLSNDKIKKARFQYKAFLKKSKLHFAFFSSRFVAISIMTDKLSPHIAISYILFSKKLWRGFKSEIG